MTRATSPGAQRRLGILGSMVAVSIAMGLLGAGLVLPAVLVLDTGARETREVMSELPVELPMGDLPQRSTVYADSGEPVATFYRENRVVVRLDQVAPVMQQALLAIEDSRFYQHGALDVRGTIRALVANQTRAKVVQGGSSLTQQLVKQTLVGQARNPAEQRAATEDSYARKLRELRYAAGIEMTRSKDWILERYLNTVYFGGDAYGVEAAAEHYFDKSAAELRLGEAALLAGLVKNPSGYDPARDRQAAEQRQRVVLARMAELGMVDERRAAAVERRGLDLQLTSVPNGCLSSSATYFCDYVHQYLLHDPALGATPGARRRTLMTGGIAVHTSVDLREQRAAEQSTAQHVRPTDGAVGALAMVEPGTGLVRAVAQSRPLGVDTERGETFLNLAIDQSLGGAAGFQAGSTFKAFVLASAITQGIPTDTRITSPPQLSLPLDDFPSCSGPYPGTGTWTVKNSTGSGTFDLYGGTQQSVNTFFAQLELQTGLCDPYRLAQSMGVGLTDPATQLVPSFTLGVADVSPLEMAAAYATFAARGLSCTPRPVTRVDDSAGRSLASYPAHCTQVMPEATADTVNDILRGVQEPGGFGHDAGLGLDQPSAGKTGTTNSNHAVWFVGYTPTLSTAAVIAGADTAGRPVALDGQEIGGHYVTFDAASGSTLAGPLWATAMQGVQGLLPDTDFWPVPPPAADSQDLPLTSGVTPP